jgi:hypothetical protein
VPASPLCLFAGFLVAKLSGRFLLLSLHPSTPFAPLRFAQGEGQRMKGKKQTKYTADVFLQRRIRKRLCRSISLKRGAGNQLKEAALLCGGERLLRGRRTSASSATVPERQFRQRSRAAYLQRRCRRQSLRGRTLPAKSISLPQPTRAWVNRTEHDWYR